MSGFRRIKMSLFLMLLHLTTVTGQYLAFVVKDGDEVALPCENVTCNQTECENTNWLFSGSGNRPAVELVTLGQIGENGEAESDRLSVTANCSLVIKKVTAEDAGRYTCRQSRSGQQQGPDSQVHLSVVDMDEYEDHEKVTLSCSVSTYAWCTQTVKWLFKGKDVDKDIRDVKTSQAYCSARVLFMTSTYIYSSRHELFMCEATDMFTGKVQQFTFSPQSSGEDAVTMRTTENSTKAAFATPHGERFIIVSVGLAALITIVVAVNIWTRTKGNKTQMDENTVHDVEDDGTVNYENVGHLYASVSFH